MKKEKHSFVFKHKFKCSYICWPDDVQLRKDVLKNNVMDSFRKRFKWLSELPDEDLLGWLKYKKKKVKAELM